MALYDVRWAGCRGDDPSWDDQPENLVEAESMKEVVHMAVAQWKRDEPMDYPDELIAVRELPPFPPFVVVAFSDEHGVSA